jgi:hypothetical protein
MSIALSRGGQVSWQRAGVERVLAPNFTPSGPEFALLTPAAERDRSALVARHRLARSEDKA